MAERVLGTLKGKKALLVGAGEMGTLVAKAVAGKEVEAVLIANRTYEKAEELAKRIGGIAVRFDRLVEYLKVCDVVISATSAPHSVITRRDVEKAMKERSQKLLIIDIALPRDVEESVAELAGVELLTIDDLRRISEENLARRREEISKVERIIEEELEQLKLLLKDISARNAIAAMYSLAEKFVGEEVEELYAKLNAKYGVSEDVKDLLNDFANSLIKKFLREPTVRLREAARKGEFHVIESVSMFLVVEMAEFPKVRMRRLRKANLRWMFREARLSPEDSSHRFSLMKTSERRNPSSRCLITSEFRLKWLKRR